MNFPIALKNVSFAYDGGRTLVSSVDTSFAEGKITAVISGIGSGKSTFIKVAAGLLRPTEGSLLVSGRSFWDLTDIEQSDIRKLFGFYFQEGALIANMTILSNLALPLKYNKGLHDSAAKKIVEPWLEKLGLMNHANELPAALSLRLKRRVAFARAMMTNARWFFWDDPTDGTDEELVCIFTQAICDIKQEGRGQIIVTSDTSFAKKVADEIFYLKDGKLSMDAPCGRL